MNLNLLSLKEKLLVKSHKTLITGHGELFHCLCGKHKGIFQQRSIVMLNHMGKHKGKKWEFDCNNLVYVARRVSREKN